MIKILIDQRSKKCYWTITATRKLVLKCQSNKYKNPKYCNFIKQDSIKINRQTTEDYAQFKNRLTLTG